MLSGFIPHRRVGRGARLLVVFGLAWLSGHAAETTGLVDLLGRWFDHDMDIITVTDFTDEGRKLPVASKAAPVYYEALILGYRDWGRPLAGNPTPDKRAMVKLILKVLADQGYYPCNARHKPSLMLALSWGTINRSAGTSVLFMGGDKLDVLWEIKPEFPGMIDPRMLTRSMRRSHLADLVMESANDEIYIASVQAFDEAAALQGKTVRLWHTKISCPARGLDMVSTLREMIRVAGPQIGRETAQPILVTKAPREGVVTMGELKVLEMIDPDVLPVTDLTEPAPAKKP